MRIRVQLAHGAAEAGIDDSLDSAGGLGVARQKVPKLAVGILEASDRGLAVLPTQHAAIRRLAAATRIERRLSKDNLARLRLQHLGLERQRFGVVVAEIMRHRITGGCGLVSVRYLCQWRCSRIGDNCGALSRCRS